MRSSSTAASAVGFLALLAACAPGSTSAAPAASGGPVETRAPNAPYKPAFPQQTRAPRAAGAVEVQTTVVARGLENPWALEFLPDGRMLATEKPGRMRIVAADGTLSAPVAGVPEVDSRGQGGLLDVAVDPQFASNRTIFFSYSEPREEGKNATTLARARLSDGPAPRLEDVTVIFRQQPAWTSNLHFGSRIVFAADGTLFLTVGERSVPDARVHAQDLTMHLGKVIRINKDGTVPRDNPFVGRADVKPEIWSYGHRNVQAAVLQPGTNLLWTIEHGPRGGDEVNQPEKGKNYGWPTICYCIEYSGQPMPGGKTAQAGMEQPIYYWDPVIAPSGSAFYTGALFPGWRGNLFVGAHVNGGGKLVRLVLDGKRVVGEDWLLQDIGERIRDVKQGPDGALYVVTDSADGKIIRLTPRR
jgi:glucose/arabinose dehydrogenase